MSYIYGDITNCKDRNNRVRPQYECRLGYQVNSQSIANNTSNITLRLEVRSINSNYNTRGAKQTTTIDGTTLSASTFDMSNTNVWQIFGERTITVNHNSSGVYSSSKSGSFTTNVTSSYSEYALKSGEASVIVNPTTIPRYPDVSQSLNSKTSSSIEINWTSDSSIDYAWYSIDDGNNWTSIGSVSGTSGSYNITGLNSNTTYNIKTKLRRSDSQLSAETDSLSITTYQATIPTISLSSKTVNSITVTSSCNVSCQNTNYRIKTSEGSYSDAQVSPTFNELSPNTAYVVGVWTQGTESEEWGYAEVAVTTYQIATIVAPNFNLGDSFDVTITNPSGQEIAFFIQTLKDGSTEFETNLRTENTTAGTRTITLTDSELDMIYKKIGTGTSTTIRLGVRTIGTYYDWQDKTCTLTGNQKTAHINISNSWKRGKTWINVNGTWKRGVIWQNVNGTWKKCI